jgi:hypothetical protein
MDPFNELSCPPRHQAEHRVGLGHGEDGARGLPHRVEPAFAQPALLVLSDIGDGDTRLRGEDDQRLLVLRCEVGLSRFSVR